jgi:hypothetical protein
VAPWKSTEVSKKHITSIFRVKEQKKETSMKAGGKQNLKQTALHGNCLHTNFLLGLFFDSS